MLPYLNTETQYHRSSTNENPSAPQGPHSWNNPYWVLFEMMQRQELNRSYGNIKLDYKPIDWATISYNIGADYSFDKRLDILPIGTYRNGGIGRMFRNLNNSLEWDANFIVTIDGNTLFGYPTKITMGHNLNSRSSNTIKNLGNEQIVPNYFQMENFASQSITEYVSLINTESVFAQVSHDILDEIYLTAALRQDGSSTFGPSDRQHLFRKLSGAWDFTKDLQYHLLIMEKFEQLMVKRGSSQRYTVYIQGTSLII